LLLRVVRGFRFLSLIGLGRILLRDGGNGDDAQKSDGTNQQRERSRERTNMNAFLSTDFWDERQRVTCRLVGLFLAI
jgi:hypothetical protein